MRRNKRRLLAAAGAITALGAAATLILGVTFGLFSATTPSVSSTFTAGTVTLAQSAVTTCTTPTMSPGDSSSGFGSGSGTDTQCKFTITYGGNVPAWLGLDVSIASTAPGSPVAPYGGGATPTAAPGLYDSSAIGLQVLIKDNQGTPVTYMTGTTLGGTATTGASPSTADLLVNTASFTSGSPVTFTVDYKLPATAGNAYQAAASSITLTAHAVQANNNGNTTGCTAGSPCTSITSWS